MYEAQFFIRLATDLYDQWQINELTFYSAVYRLSSYRNSYIKSLDHELYVLIAIVSIRLDKEPRSK